MAAATLSSTLDAMPPPRIVVFTRYPTPGRAKTRLIPALGASGAADLHRRLTELTLDAVRASDLKFEFHVTGASRIAFEAWLGDVHLVDQGEGDLGARLAAAGPPYPTIFIGADAPDLTGALLRTAAAALGTHDAVIGPAEDGGYWLLGLARAQDLFTDMPWSTETICAETLRRLASVGIIPFLLPTLADCDLPEDLDRWPALTRGRPI